SYVLLRLNRRLQTESTAPVWDALSSNRPYRKAWEREEIPGYIRDLSGKQFDPKVVEAFLRMIENETGHAIEIEARNYLQNAMSGQLIAFFISSLHSQEVPLADL
ncbi:MAG: hypothetical protein MZV64_02125, partial [Ignavibacteriales bacterium]|nr:hypothetical protein [Ignavibacteriales bacterium]